MTNTVHTTTVDSQAFLHRFQSHPDVLEVRSLVGVLAPAVLDAADHEVRTVQLRRLRTEQPAVDRILNSLDNL